MRNTISGISMVLFAALALLVQDPAQAQERKLRFGVMKIGALSNAHLAREQGLFKKQGVDVELVIIRSGAEGVTALQSGSIDVTLAIPSFALAANERNFDLVMVMQNEIARSAPPDTGGIVVAKDSDIRRLSDLAGRTVAINSLHAQEAVSAQYVIKKAGVPKDKVKYVEVPFPTMWDVISRKQADAAVGIDPFTTMMVQRGGRVIAWEYVEAVPEQPIGVFWSKRAWAEKNADLLERFTLGMEDAIAYMNADARRARGVVAQFTGLPGELIEAMPPIQWSSKVNVAKYRELVEMLKSMDELTTTPRPEDYFSAGAKRRAGLK
jgi:NitT/TauT family transport system substrate-binding protein